MGTARLAEDTAQATLDAMGGGGQVYGSVRGCIRGWPRSSCRRAAHGIVAIGCHLDARKAARSRTAMYDGTRNTNFAPADGDALRSQFAAGVV